MNYCNFCGKMKGKCKNEFLISRDQRHPMICIECVSKCNLLLQNHKSNIRRVIDFSTGE